MMQWGYRYSDYYEWDGKCFIRLPLDSHCHALITGSSGSGKSNAGLWLLSRYMNVSSSIIYILDFKAGKDWDFLSSYPHYYAGMDCLDGLRDYYKAFRNATDNQEIRHLLLFDEYSSFLTYLTMQDKINKTKLSLEAQSMMLEILAMGRSKSYGIWIFAQRPDSNLLPNGSRDNFMVQIALGSISKEHRQMMFAGYEVPAHNYKAGRGLLLADGGDLQEVIYPLLEDLSEWKYQIHRLLMEDYLEDVADIGE